MRNEEIGSTVEWIVERLDHFSDGAVISKYPTKEVRKIFDEVLETQKGSVRLASIFLLAYSVRAKGWNYIGVPVGVRGKYGDKRLAAAFTERHVTLHSSITAFGENLGWKGNVSGVDLRKDGRFSTFVRKIKKLKKPERAALLDYAVYKACESRVVPKPLPPLPADWLSYPRALQLCQELLAVSSEGHVQQFLVAGFLAIHRKRCGTSIQTHHPHASDKFDSTAGDIEEFRDSKLVAAYEVTVRDDWKNRLPDFQKKAADAGLSKYVIIASNVRNDPSLSSAVALLGFLDGVSLDLAVVDIAEFFYVFCAELRADEIRDAINLTYEHLLNTKLCGRIEFIEAFSGIASSWIDSH